MFDLEQSITEWRKQMLAAGIKSPVPLDELENHLREEIEQQMNSGLNEQQAFQTAVLRIGQAGVLKTEFVKAKGLFGLLVINMSTAYKVIRFLGLLGAAWIAWTLIVTMVVGTQVGAQISSRYLLTVTVPYGLLAVFLVLPYSKMKGRLWTASFVLFCLSGAYVGLYLVTHLFFLEEWLMISEFFAFVLSQVAVIWLSRRGAERSETQKGASAKADA